jgi:hypothetical protein
MFLGQVTFVLGLQIDAPGDRVFELLPGLLQDRDRIGVIDPFERFG